jgi:hypothetical protein
MDALIRGGELVKVRHGIYATSGILAKSETDPCLRHALEVAAVTTRTHRGVASHHSAALIHGLDLLKKPPDGTVALTVPPGARTGRHGRSGIIRHAANLPSEHVMRRYVSVTTVARTVTDIARTAPFMEAVVVADSALHKRQTSKTELGRVLASCPRWPGVEQARLAVSFASQLAESVLESCARVFLHEQGLPRPALQVSVSGEHGFIGRVDFCWGKYRTVAEADGLLKYRGDDGDKAVTDQLTRDRLLREAGYEVVHFTWKELFSDPARVAARIRAAFNRAARLGLT